MECTNADCLLHVLLLSAEVAIARHGLPHHQRLEDRHMHQACMSTLSNGQWQRRCSDAKH